MSKHSDQQTVRDNAARQRFEIDLGEGDMAIAEYRLEGDVITFTHTAVPPRHGGKGIASKLAQHALAAARSRHLKVVPACAFFAAFIERHPEYRDLTGS